MWGISNSNFSGNMGIFLNPSTIVAAPYQYEFNFISVDGFASNTYVYIPKSSNFLVRSATGQIGNGEQSFYDIYNTNLQSGYGHLLVIGPSVVRNRKDDGWSWGIHTAYRHEMSVKDVPPSLAKFIYSKYIYPPLINQTFNTSAFSAAWLSWGEIGGTYGRVLMEKENEILKAAITVNLLLGFEGLSLNGNNMNYTFLDSSSAVIHQMDVTISHALSTDGSSGVGDFFTIRGFGASTTIGGTYIHHWNRGSGDCSAAADDIKKYQYRLGVSLMDFGMIHFSNQAQIINVNTVTDRPWNHIDTIKFHSVGQLDTLLSNNINGTVNSAQNHSFTMYLPTAISLQFDYCFAPRWYGNVSWVNRIYYSNMEIARGNQIEVAGRYEKRSFEAALDLSLFEYSQPAVGFGIRYGIFVFGTDRLLELLNLTDIRSFDLFFGFKMNLCDMKKRQKGSCPAYKD